MKKTVRIDRRADKEIKHFPSPVQAKIKTYLFILSRDGQLSEPYSKKVDSVLFEIRIKYQGQWRVLYAYIGKNYVIILSAFHKKTQKTPLAEINKSKLRLKGYQL